MKIKRIPLTGAMRKTLTIILALILVGMFMIVSYKYTKLKKTNELLNSTIAEQATQIENLIATNIDLTLQLEEKNKQLEEANKKILQAISKTVSKPMPTNAQSTTTVSSNNSGTNLGQFKISAYCACAKCCGKSDGITATGVKATANRTIAVDPNVIPLGSKVKIGDRIYVAEDTGGGIKGNRIDMYFPTHQEALNWGIQYRDVSLVQ